MRKYFYILIILSVTLGCGRPKTISDTDLQQILQEVYLVNAYCTNNPIDCDSIDIYEPILSKYNYTAADMAYTISNYSKRKSSRLTDVINEAILGLEREYKIYDRQVAILDTINTIAEERFKKIIYEDSSLIVRSLRDTSKLRIKLPAKDGKYKISYNYQFDSTDTNYGLRAQYTITSKTRYAVASNTNWLRTYNRENVSVVLNSSSNAKDLMLQLATYNKNATTPYVKIDSLVVVYYMPIKESLDSINLTLIDYKLLIDGKEYRHATQDSSALHTYPPRSITPRDSLR